MSADNPAGVKSLWQVLENHLLPPELEGFGGQSSGSCHGLRAKQAFADKPEVTDSTFWSQISFCGLINTCEGFKDERHCEHTVFSYFNTKDSPFGGIVLLISCAFLKLQKNFKSSSVFQNSTLSR